MPDYKKRLIKKIENTYCRLKPSKNHGIGIFAIRDIAKGTKLFSGVPKNTWQKLNISDFKNSDAEIKKMIDDFAVVEKNGEVYLPTCGLEGMNMSFYLNYSKTPNVRTVDGGQHFAAVKKIKKGEELATAYSDFDYKYQ